MKNGDIIFVASAASALTQAIDAVTQTDAKTHFVHMGIIAKNAATLSILHADTETGVCEQLLDSFAYKANGLFVYRIKKLSETAASEAIAFARKHIGEPYNYTYILPDTGFYCSEYVYAAFEPFSIFELNPMTFKNSGTEQMNETWVDYYKKLGIEVPEGALGCNPNGMASSPNLVFIGQLIR